MSDSYAAIYNAVRSQIGNCDVNSAISDAIKNAFDISHITPLASYAIDLIRDELSRPSVLFRPHLSKDGNKWCALYGDNLQEGICGFGDSPSDAMYNFDKNWRAS